jgi:hypothetical protein
MSRMCVPGQSPKHPNGSMCTAPMPARFARRNDVEQSPCYRASFDRVPVLSCMKEQPRSGSRNPRWRCRILPQDVARSPTRRVGPRTRRRNRDNRHSHPVPLQHVERLCDHGFVYVHRLISSSRARSLLPPRDSSFRRASLHQDVPKEIPKRNDEVRTSRVYGYRIGAQCGKEPRRCVRIHCPPPRPDPRMRS